MTTKEKVVTRPSMAVHVIPYHGHDLCIFSAQGDWVGAPCGGVTLVDGNYGKTVWLLPGHTHTFLGVLDPQTSIDAILGDVLENCLHVKGQLRALVVTNKCEFVMLHIKPPTGKELMLSFERTPHDWELSITGMDGILRNRGTARQLSVDRIIL